MGAFDMHTIIVSFLLTYVVSTLVIFILWVQFHDRYKGTTYLVWNFALQLIGLFLIVLRGKIPDLVSIDLSNTLIIGGLIMGYMGFAEYTGEKSSQIHNFILLAIFAGIHTWFTFLKPDLNVRSLNISIVSLFIFLQCSWLMLFRARKNISMTHPIGLVFLGFSIISLTNILKFFFGNKEMPLDYFESGSFDVIIIILNHMLVILLTYSLVLMYSKNLLLDIKGEEEKNYLTNSEKIAEHQKYNELKSYESNLLRTLINNLPDPISVKDKEGKYLINNVAHLDMIGAESQEDTIGKTVFDFLPEEEAAKLDEEDKLVLKTGKMILDKLECSNSAETGFPYWHLTSRIPIIDNEGTSFQLVTVSHDISKRKKAEDSLKESAEFNRSLLKTIPFGMDIVDETGTILFQNDNFKKISGSDAIGRKCWDVYRDDKKQCSDCPLLRGVASGKTEIYESHGLLGGKVFDIYHTGMIFQGRKAMLEIFNDVTDNKLTEDELIRSKERAEESDRLKTAFLHNISHEIRTPMNAIVGFTALLSQPDISPENHRSYLEIITQSSDHLLSIVIDIIEISNVEAGKMKLNMKKVFINSMLENLHRQFSPLAGLKRLEFTFENSGSDSESFFYTDTTKLTQVLSNLLSNAFKFTKQGYIKVGYKRKPEFIDFYVSDTGIGIPEEQHSKIFDRFYQVDSGQDREYEGTGLGLSLSKAYIEFLGGKLWVESEVGKGSTFFISLPC